MGAVCEVAWSGGATRSGRARANVATGWNEHLARLLVDGGLAAEEASPFATLLRAAIEGAVVLSRPARDLAPFASVAASLMRQVDDVMRRGRRCGFGGRALGTFSP